MTDASDLLALISQHTLVLVGLGCRKILVNTTVTSRRIDQVGALSEVADKGRHATTTADYFTYRVEAGSLTHRVFGTLASAMSRRKP